LDDLLILHQVGGELYLLYYQRYVSVYPSEKEIRQQVADEFERFFCQCDASAKENAVVIRHQLADDFLHTLGEDLYLLS
jgi:hypothetical protein